MMGRLIGCIALGCVFAGPGMYYAIRASRLRTWPAVQGRIVSSELVWDTNTPHIKLKPKIKYVYTVQGTEYQGTHLTIADWFYTTGLLQARSFHRRFPVGKDVLVYYNLENHSKSIVVKPGFMAPLVMIVLGVISFYVFWRYGLQSKRL